MAATRWPRPERGRDGERVGRADSLVGREVRREAQLKRNFILFFSFSKHNTYIFIFEQPKIIFTS
jgi:hypothetical protein